MSGNAILTFGSHRARSQRFPLFPPAGHRHGWPDISGSFEATGLVELRQPVETGWICAGRDEPMSRCRSFPLR